jgi:uncharacterized protein
MEREERIVVSADTSGAPTWVELSTSDVDAAIGFYRALLGWAVTRSETPGGRYALVAVGDLEIGGMLGHVADEGVWPTWTVFFQVADVDASTAAVLAAGGSVLQPAIDVPAARIAVVADPTGGILGVRSGSRPTVGYLDQGPGTVAWVELLTRDPQATEPFYTEVFGWKAASSLTGGTAYTTFTLEDEQVAGMMLMPDEVPAEVPAYWSMYVGVEDVEASVARAIELGGGVIAPPMNADGRWFAVLEDPQGAVFGVLELTGTG